MEGFIRCKIVVWNQAADRKGKGLLVPPTQLPQPGVPGWLLQALSHASTPVWTHLHTQSSFPRNLLSTHVPGVCLGHARAATLFFVEAMSYFLVKTCHRIYKCDQNSKQLAAAGEFEDLCIPALFEPVLRVTFFPRWYLGISLYPWLFRSFPMTKGHLGALADTSGIAR